ncbi:hypothetical protein DM02DRAFT_694957 [Periconia macrospinosa]|uniref:Uncharacterized protein n=1 Tax=Periconia macrospinosa TaxID=97972 RepID=A0A2V1DZY7_9PLEO|nr:hypothetical protein DM02DRAFT_694957 [Periconia macrospinosa]
MATTRIPLTPVASAMQQSHQSDTMPQHQYTHSFALVNGAMTERDVSPEIDMSSEIDEPPEASDANPSLETTSANPASGVLPTAPEPETTIMKTASLSIDGDHLLHFTEFPEYIVRHMFDLIDKCWQILHHGTWPPDSHSLRFTCDYYQVALYGLPWVPWQTWGLFDSKKLIRRILEELYELGWNLVATANMGLGKDVLLFHYTEGARPTYQWATLAFLHRDMLMFLDFPPNIHRLMRSKMTQEGIRTVVSEDENKHQSMSFLTDSWQPWVPNSGPMAKKMLLRVFTVLQDEGWSVYASIKQENIGYNWAYNCTWHCRKLIS